MNSAEIRYLEQQVSGETQARSNAKSSSGKEELRPALSHFAKAALAPNLAGTLRPFGHKFQRKPRHPGSERARNLSVVSDSTVVDKISPENTHPNTFTARSFLTVWIGGLGHWNQGC